MKSRLDIWLYFLRRADTMDTDTLPVPLAQDPLVLRAFEELKMLTHTDQERERYEARRKAQLDYNTAMKVARMEGRAEGRTEARIEEKIGVIQFCERLLKRPPTPREELASRSLEELTRLADELQAKVLKQP